MISVFSRMLVAYFEIPCYVDATVHSELFKSCKRMLDNIWDLPWTSTQT